ncbi:MAG: hypothetical protein M5U09_18980 [Gammaproteobacteria bacterium]|nr:hypothetical protein [Gammaproteobacteria bacterium]
MAVAAFGAGLQEKSQMKKIIRARKEMMANFSPADFEEIGLDSTWIGTLEGVHENIDKIYAAVDGKLVEALKEAGAITGAIGLRMAVNGEHVHQLHGQVEKVRTALEGAKITGFSFAGSIETAIEKGNGLQVSIQGNAEIIRGALENAAEAGDLAFRNFQQTATGATAILTGDIGKWQRVMQEFVNTAVKAAVSGVGELGREAGSATEKFLARRALPPASRRCARRRSVGATASPTAASRAARSSPGCPRVRTRWKRTCRWPTAATSRCACRGRYLRHPHRPTLARWWRSCARCARISTGWWAGRSPARSIAGAAAPRPPRGCADAGRLRRPAQVGAQAAGAAGRLRGLRRRRPGGASLLHGSLPDRRRRPASEHHLPLAPGRARHRGGDRPGGLRVRCGHGARSRRSTATAHSITSPATTGAAPPR